MVQDFLRKLNQKLHWEGYFLLFIILFMFALTGQGYSVTEIITKGVRIPQGKLMAWGAWITFLVGMVGALCSGMYWWLKENPHLYTTILIFITIMWTWAGGILDFLHFMMVGNFPSIDYIWFWMPFYCWLNIKWTIFHHSIYTLCVTSPLILGWLYHFHKKHKL